MRNLLPLICLLFLLFLAYPVDAQTSFCPDDPPLNPWLADSPYPIYHRNNYAQASTCLPGILPGDSIIIKARTDISGSTSPWIYFSDQYPNGERVILYSNSTHVFKFIDDGSQIVAIDSLRIDFDRLNSNGYNHMLTKDRIWFTYDSDYDPAKGEYTRLFKMSDEDPNDPYSDIVMLDTFSFEKYGINKVSMYNLNYRGEIVWYSHEDFAKQSAWVGMIDQDLNLLDTLRYSLYPNEIVNHNSIAVDENNSFFIVTTHRLIQFDWDGNRLSLAWEALYDFVNDGPTGNFANGSGTTPTLMGWGAGKDKLVVVADGHAENHLIAFWRELPAGWTGLPGMDIRFADSIAIPFAQSFGNLFQSIENSPTVSGYDVAIAQFNGFLGYDCDNRKGVQKFSWDTLSKQFTLAWATDQVNMNGVLCYSSGSNLVYGTGKESDCNYYYYGLDWDSGELIVKKLLGSEGAFPNDPFYDQGVNHIIDEEGNMYFSGSRSLVKLEKYRPTTALPTPPLPPPPDIFPNPTTGLLHLSGADLNGYQAKLYSILGQGKAQWQLSGQDRLDISHLEDGVYYLVLSKEGQIVSKKVVKQTR
ncbi:MAG: T9SS type A sorting domain-containing protein [Bacteroidota bacterium]